MQLAYFLKLSITTGRLKYWNKNYFENYENIKNIRRTTLLVTKNQNINEKSKKEKKCSNNNYKNKSRD